MQSLRERTIEVPPDSLGANSSNNIRPESVGQEFPRGGRIHSAAPQVEQRCLIQGAERGTVGALHVVGIYLELWLTISAGFTGKKQVVVGLL